MSEAPEYLDQTPPPPGGEMSAVETWIAAISKPNENTFAEIAAQPGATTGKAFLWVAIAALISAFFGALSQTVNAGQSMEMLREFLPPDVAYALPSGGSGAGVGFGTILCGAPLGAVVGVIFFAIGVGLIQWVAQLFGGTGSFEKLAYTFAAIMVPISVVTAVLSLLGMIPFIGVLFGIISFAVSIYSFVLNVLAVKAVNHLDTGRAVGAVLLPGVVFFLVICCCFAIVGLALGPSIAEFFNEIQRGMY